MTLVELEQRLAVLEEVVHDLKAHAAFAGSTSSPPESREAGAVGAGEPWFIKGAGRFANDPIFDEIVRLGRDYRESSRPDPGEGPDDRP